MVPALLDSFSARIRSFASSLAGCVTRMSTATMHRTRRTVRLPPWLVEGLSSLVITRIVSTWTCSVTGTTTAVTTPTKPSMFATDVPRMRIACWILFNASVGLPVGLPAFPCLPGAMAPMIVWMNPTSETVPSVLRTLSPVRQVTGVSLTPGYVTMPMTALTEVMKLIVVSKLMLRLRSRASQTSTTATQVSVYTFTWPVTTTLTVWMHLTRDQPSALPPVLTMVAVPTAASPHPGVQYVSAALATT